MPRWRNNNGSIQGCAGKRQPAISCQQLQRFYDIIWISNATWCEYKETIHEPGWGEMVVNRIEVEKEDEIVAFTFNSNNPDVDDIFSFLAEDEETLALYHNYFENDEGFLLVHEHQSVLPNKALVHFVPGQGFFIVGNGTILFSLQDCQELYPDEYYYLDIHFVQNFYESWACQEGNLLEES